MTFVTSIVRGFLYILPRPSMGWLSHKDVYGVYARLRALFYKDPRPIAAPGGLHGAFPVLLQTSPSAGPLFQLDFEGSRYRFWLNCHPERRHAQFHFQKDDEDVDVLPLTDPRCRIIFRILTGLCFYFPLYPSEDDVVYLDGPPEVSHGV